MGEKPKSTPNPKKPEKLQEGRTISKPVAPPVRDRPQSPKK